MSEADEAAHEELHPGRKWLVRAFLVVLAVAAAVGYYFYAQYTDLHPSTSDAYIGANIVRIAPEVPGRVLDVPRSSNDKVAAGDILLTLDPALYQARLDTAVANLGVAENQAGTATANVAAARAALVTRQAALTNAQRQHDRVAELVRKGDISEADLDKSTAALNEAQAAVNQANAELEAAIQTLGDKGSKNAQVQAALADVEAARLNLSYAQVVAPTDGQLGPVTLRPGAYVDAGTDLFPLVESDTWYVTANFKETDIERIQPGMPVRVTVDMYPGTTWNGVVESLSPASGAAFALLPPENATGNWVKVTQRFPIRISLKNDQPGAPLRVGASATVTVDTTKDTAGPQAAPEASEASEVSGPPTGSDAQPPAPN